MNKSRPIYPGLHIDPNARQHLFALEGRGMDALMDQVGAAPPGFLAAAELLCVGQDEHLAASLARLQQLGLRDFWRAPTIATLLTRLRAALAGARMGMRLYVAGTEGFIGQVVQLALQFDVDPGSIVTEHRGSLQRRVQCVHCKGITDAVKTSPFACGHCGLQLLVRDHYSRRIGAFQGVNIDAEAPGTAPPAEELYP